MKSISKNWKCVWPWCSFSVSKNICLKFFERVLRLWRNVIEINEYCFYVLKTGVLAGDVCETDRPSVHGFPWSSDRETSHGWDGMRSGLDTSSSLCLTLLMSWRFSALLFTCRCISTSVIHSYIAYFKRLLLYLASRRWYSCRLFRNSNL